MYAGLQRLADIYQLYGEGAGQRMGGAPPAYQPAPGLRSAADLYTPPPTPVYPEAPVPPRSLADLDPETAKRVRQQTLLASLASGLSAFDEGRLGEGLLQGVLGSQGYEQQAIAQARADQEARYRADLAAAERQARADTAASAQQAQQRQADTAFAAYQQVAQIAGASAPELVQQAEIAARAGDIGTLQKLVGVARDKVAYVEALRAKGIDPSNPLAVQQYTAQQEDARRLAQVTAETTAREQIQRQFAPPRQPAAPREGAMAYDAQGNAFLVDQVTGQARPVRLPGGGQLARDGRDSGGDPAWGAAVNQALRQNQDAVRQGEAPMSQDQLVTLAEQLYSLYKSPPSRRDGNPQPILQGPPMMSSRGAVAPTAAPQSSASNLAAEIQARLEALRARGATPEQLRRAEAELRQLAGLR